MGCSAESLPDSLMDDFARCVHSCEMDPIEMVFFLGQCGHESCGLRYPVEIHDGSNYEGREDLGIRQPGGGEIRRHRLDPDHGSLLARGFAASIGDPKVWKWARHTQPRNIPGASPRSGGGRTT